LGCNKSTITLIVNTTKDIEEICIAGNIPELGDWDPSKIKLDKISENRFELKLQLTNTAEIEYKFTRGSWSNEALDSNETIPNNHHLIISKDTTIAHTIIKWRDEIFLESQITGKVEYHRDFYSPQLDNYRDIIVWLPPSYNKEQKYPVLYLHDGQNVFDPSTSFIGIDWQLDETVMRLIAVNKLKEIIMVGIYNTENRTSEYSPIHKGESYANFLIETVKPFIDSTYCTLQDTENTAIVGSSMGGIISFHIAWEYPEIFSMGGCFSPAFLVDDWEIVKRVKSDKEISPVKLVILNGSVGLEAELQPAIFEMVSALKEKEFNNMIYQIFEGAGHDEAAWAEQVEIPLLYFFGK